MSWFEHDGGVDWRCSTCGKEGTQVFLSLRTEGAVPSVADYDALLTNTEVDHALAGCNGRLVSAGGFRHRFVEHGEAS